MSEEIEIIDQELFEFGEALIKSMYKNKWVWLAAPQIGKNIRMIATTQRDTSSKKSKIISETIMVNPKITHASQEMIVWEEACISLPDLQGKVKRHKCIGVEYLDPKGNKQKKKYKDFDAVIIQHEIDHLDGVLFIDKLVKKRKK